MESDVVQNSLNIPEITQGPPVGCQNVEKPSDPLNAKHYCPACSITFSRNSHLKRHLKTQHGQVFLETPNRGSQCSLWCPLCGERFTSRAHTENHIVAFHQVEIRRENFTFYTEEEFAEWKTNLERAECCSYVSTKGESRLSNGTFAKYYHCHRCGKYQSTVKGERKRRLKVNGTIKIGTYCPSRIKRFTTIIDSAVEISVEYVSTHIGHGRDVDSSKKRKRSHLPEDDPSKDRVLKNLQSTVNRSKKGHKLPEKDLNVLPSLPFKATEMDVIPSTTKEISDDTSATKMQETTESVLFLYQPQCTGIPQWNEYQERVPQDMVIVNSEAEKITLEDPLIKRRENFMSMLQVAASKIDNAVSEQHFDIIDRFALAIISHLDGFLVQEHVMENQVVQDNVTYHVLGASQ